MHRIFVVAALLFLSSSASSNNLTFMKEFFSSQNGKLINVMGPCDPGCYVEIDIDGNLISTTTSGIDFERLYELKNDKDRNITLNYSLEYGSYVVHTSTNTKFLLNGRMDKHPIDFALKNCYSSPQGSTSIGMKFCLINAEEAWDNQLNITYNQLGGSSNEPLKKAQQAWIKYRDAQFDWFYTHFGSKQGSKWDLAISERKITLIRQQVEFLQSAYAGH
jgi:uncharacterized protein YecT (DUF1311 family)